MAASTTSFDCVTGDPLILILKGEFCPPAKRIVDNVSFWPLRFIILKDWVIVPVAANTVSNWMVSAEKEILASGLVMKESFLQEMMSNANKKDIRNMNLGICFKNTNNLKRTSTGKRVLHEYILFY